jgi:hypothetical protein
MSVAATFLDQLTSALNSPAVILHNFLLELKVRNKIVHAFFEGKTDESFYGTFIRGMIDEDYKLKTYICGNKDGVHYQFNRLRNTELGNNISVYFTDKDIEDIIPFPRDVHSKIYVTDFYSVENYIVSDVMLEQVWAEIFRQTSGNNASKLIKAKFATCLNDFHEFMLLIMAWILYHRRNIEKLTKISLNLDCIKLKDAYIINDELDFIFTMNEDDIINLISLQTGCATSLKSFNKNKKTLIAELRKHPMKNIVRGHFEMEFFIYFIGRAKNALNKALGKALKVHLELTDANSIDVLGPRVQIPNSLNVFLHKNLSSIGNLQGATHLTIQ